MDIFIALLVWTIFIYTCGKAKGRKQMRPALDEFDAKPGRIENVYSWHSHDEQVRQLRSVIIEQQRQLQARGSHGGVTLKPLTADEGRQYMPTKLQLHSARGLRVYIEWTDNGGVNPDIRFTSTTSGHAHHSPEGWRAANELASYSAAGAYVCFDLPCEGEWLIVVRQDSPNGNCVTQWSNQMRVHVFDTVVLEAIDTAHGRVMNRRTKVTDDDRRGEIIEEVHVPDRAVNDDRATISQGDNYVQVDVGVLAAVMRRQRPDLMSVQPDIATMPDGELRIYVEHLQYLLSERARHAACSPPVESEYVLGSHGWTGKEESE